MSIKYRNYKSADFLSTARLLRDVSRKFFIIDALTEEGKEFWWNSQSLTKSNIPKLKKTFSNCSIKLVATYKDKLAGFVFGNSDELVMLFVRPRLHGRSIATNLTEMFFNRVRENGSKQVKLFSSLYAFRFYKKMGFKRIGKNKLIKDLPTVPMEIKV